MAFRNLERAFSRLSLISGASRGSQQSAISSCRRLSLPLPFPSLTTLHTSRLATTSAALTPHTPAPHISLTLRTHCQQLPSLSGLSPPITCTTAHSPTLLSQVRWLSLSEGRAASLYQMHRTGPIKKNRKNKNPLVNRPFARGVILKTLIKKPKKPNSANRKCVLVRLTTGREMVAYVPGEGHNLQEHNIVLVRPGRLRDVPGVKLRCVRGKYDLQHVIKKQH